LIRYNTWLDGVERRESFRGEKSDYIRHDMSERIFSFDSDFFNQMMSSIDQTSVITYPSRYEYQTLKKRIAVENSVHEDQIMVTPGSDSSLRIIFEALCSKGKRVITTDPCFPMYDVYASINGSILDKVKYDNSLNFNLSSIIPLIKSQTRLIIISNPCSPIGDYRAVNEIADLCKILSKKGIALVIDEAYYEFSPGTAASLVNKFDNVIITRTMSKACGLAGLRIGYLMASKDVFKILDKLRLAFPITSISTRFAIKIFENIHIVRQYASQTIDNRNYLNIALKSKGFDVVNTHSNWIHVNTDNNNKDLELLFNNHGISTKFGTRIPFDDRDNWLRLTVGPKMINRKIIKDMMSLGGKS
jgi:histidinol-phosphate aminotransferase